MDKLVVKLLPLMKAASVIGILAGLALAALGVAEMMGLIDTGPSFKNIEPIWMIGGGLALVVTFVFKFQRYQKQSAEAKDRLSS